MIGLRYTGALRAQGLRQEAPPTADRAFWPGSWETSLQNHQTGRQHLPRATPVGGRRRRTLTPTCQPPWDPTARTVMVPAPPALPRPDPEGCGRRPWAAGFHVTCTGWVEPAQDHPQPPCQSPPAQSQTVAGSGHDPRGPPCSPGGSTRPPPQQTRLRALPGAQGHGHGHGLQCGGVRGLRTARRCSAESVGSLGTAEEVGAHEAGEALQGFHLHGVKLPVEAATQEVGEA